MISTNVIVLVTSLSLVLLLVISCKEIICYYFSVAFHSKFSNQIHLKVLIILFHPRGNHLQHTYFLFDKQIFLLILYLVWHVCCLNLHLILVETNCSFYNDYNNLIHLLFLINFLYISDIIFHISEM